jgi:hypothetical protein
MVRSAAGTPDGELAARGGRSVPGAGASLALASVQEAVHFTYDDLQRDPLETEHLLGVRTGAPRSPAARTLHSELSDRLDEAMRECGTDQEGFVDSSTQ